MGKLVAIGIKMIAEGKLGSPPAKLYWFLAGKKTYTAIILAIAYGALQQINCTPCAEYANWLLGASAFMGTIGLVDAAVRVAPPVKPL